jgi:hypothetical protein
VLGPQHAGAHTSWSSSPSTRHAQALAWLSLKVAQAKSALESQLSGMEEGDKDAYVCGLLSEYLTPAW